MKGKIITIAIIILVILGIFIVSNHLNDLNKAEMNKFVGTWTYLVPSGTGYNYSFSYQFFPNGTFIFNKPSLTTYGTFKIISGNLWLITTLDGDKNYDDYSYVFSENNTKLTIEGTTYTKQ